MKVGVALMPSSSDCWSRTFANRHHGFAIGQAGCGLIAADSARGEEIEETGGVGNRDEALVFRQLADVGKLRLGGLHPARSHR